MKIRYVAYLFLTWVEKMAGRIPAVGCFRPVRGGFSALNLLDDNKLVGQIHVPRQASGSCPAGSITQKCGHRQHDHQPWPIFWAKAENATLFGRTLMWRNENDEICTEGSFGKTYRLKLNEGPLLERLILPKPMRLEGAWTSLVSNWSHGHNYFHWITDSLTRLYLREQLPETTRILIPQNPPRFITDSLDMLGLSEMAQPSPSVHLQVGKYYFLSPMVLTGNHNPLGYEWLRSKFETFIDPSPNGRPIFLTRRGAARTPSNLLEIERIFESKGFEIIDCGRIGIKEQMRLSSSAPAIAGLHGAAMTNIIWATEGIQVLEIFEKSYLNGCYEQIAFERNLDYTAIIREHNITELIREWVDTLRR
jgi:hypothetical protein